MLQRTKALREEPYTQKDAEAAIGLRTDHGPRQNVKGVVQDMEVEIEAPAGCSSVVI
jgi:bud site selection protein 20